MTPSQIQQKIFYGYAKAAYKLGAYFSLYRASTPINPIVSGNLIGQVQMSRSVKWEYDKANKYGNLLFNACLDAQASSSPVNCRVGDFLIPTTGGDIQYSIGSVAVVSGGTGYKVGDLIVISNIAYTPYINLTVTGISGDGIVTSVSIMSSGSFSSPLPPNPLGQYYTSGLGINATFNVTWNPLTGIDDNNTYYVQSLQFDLPPQVIQCNQTISIIRPSQATGAGNLGYVGYTKGTSITIASGLPCGFILQNSGGQADTKLPTDTRVANWTVYFPNLGNTMIRNNDIIIDSNNQEFAIYENENTELGWRLRAVQIINYR